MQKTSDANVKCAVTFIFLNEDKMCEAYVVVSRGRIIQKYMRKVYDACRM